MVNLCKVLEERQVSIRECSLLYGIPYATLYAIVNKKANINDCKYSTVKKIADFIGISTDYIDFGNEDFYIFRSNFHHRLKRESEESVRQDILQRNLIKAYLINEQPVKALYMLAFVEYVENKHHLAPADSIKEYMSYTLSAPLYFGDTEKQIEMEYIPEFKRRNIMEGNLYDAV